MGRTEGGSDKRLSLASPLANRVGLTIGAGVQFAVSRFRTISHNAILSVRLPF